MPDDNIRSTSNLALHSHAPFISLDFLPARSCFLQENTLIHPQLPQCKLKYCCALLQLWVLIFKIYNFFTYSTADVETFNIVLDLCSVNHFKGEEKSIIYYPTLKFLMGPVYFCPANIYFLPRIIWRPNCPSQSYPYQVIVYALCSDQKQQHVTNYNIRSTGNTALLSNA